MNMEFIDFRGCVIFICTYYIASTQCATSDVQCKNTRGHYGKMSQLHNPERDPEIHAGPFLEGHEKKEEGCFVIVPGLFSNSITHSQLRL